MKTKDKILNTALDLYNHFGYSNTSTRDIAKQLEISPGNLHYHFKHSSFILEELFDQFYKRLNASFDELKNNKTIDFESFYKYVHEAFLLFYDYKFLFISFIDILREIPKLNNLYLEISLVKKIEYKGLFEKFQQTNIFRKDIPSFIIDNTIEQMLIIGDNSLLRNELTQKKIKEDAVEYYSFLFLGQLYYLFTESQQLKYQQQFSNFIS